MAERPERARRLKLILQGWMTCKGWVILLEVAVQRRSRNAGCSLAPGHVARESNGRSMAKAELCLRLLAYLVAVRMGKSSIQSSIYILQSWHFYHRNISNQLRSGEGRCREQGGWKFWSDLIYNSQDAVKISGLIWPSYIL
jgi:hypothetical protein